MKAMIKFTAYNIAVNVAIATMITHPNQTIKMIAVFSLFPIYAIGYMDYRKK